jgi:hypothetical protein
VCVAGQPLGESLATITYDPFVQGESADHEGDILVHYQSPLISGDDVYLMQKGGTYTPCAPDGDGGLICDPRTRSSQTWSEAAYRWTGGRLALQWTAPTDWKPVPSPGDEPLFQPAVGSRYLYLPGGSGTIHKVDRTTGARVTTINPFAGMTMTGDLYVAGPLTLDDAGNVYYNVLGLAPMNPFSSDASAWLVKVGPDDRYVSAPYSALVPGAPAADGTCHGFFNTTDFPLPWPPPNDSDGGVVTAPSRTCLSQRPGVNIAPAIGPDGTIFTVSRAHNASLDSFVVAVRPDLSPKWASSLRDLLNDGCGVRIPTDGDTMDNRFHCRPGTTVGVDRATNLRPAGQVVDSSSSSPVALPDGAVIYGAFTGYNGSRGHLFKFGADGRFQASFDFGWDVTPAVYRHDGTYSIVTKDNHYAEDAMGVPLGPYFITQLGANLQIEWQFRNTNTMSCEVGMNGQLSCVSDHPNGFEWCINAPAVDANGVVYAGAEDGVLYAIGQGGALREHRFLSMSIGAAYTPLALDAAGRLYTLNDGVMTVIGR